MDRIRDVFRQRHPTGTQEYEPLTTSDEPSSEESTIVQEEVPFSWLEYSIFLLLGIAMLWAWNMFLAAAPYFYTRLAGDPWAQANFQSAILTVSTVTNLAVLTLLAHVQHSASYPFRINSALITNIGVFGLLTASTVLWLDTSPRVYLGFLLVAVAVAATATGMVQNGAFAFAGSFGRAEYMQALMAGQGIAGVLPPLTQVVTVLLFTVDDQNDEGGDSSAFTYFLAAVFISFITLVAFVPLVRRRNQLVEKRRAEDSPERKTVSLWRLFAKLHWLSIALALTFAETMFFPVLTAKITSVHSPEAGAIFQPAAFIPIAFFFWNLGDLSGRIATALPFSLKDRPFVLFVLSACRAGLLPLYFLCNIGSRGAVVSSDFFYLFVVQLGYGLTNGWLGSSCVMASGEWVDEGEREAAGGFMGLCLVVGLTIGSILSFTVAGI